MYKNTEISNLIVGLGLGLKGSGVEDQLSQLRYGKVSAPIYSQKIDIV